jgi:hypothetical protein
MEVIAGKADIITAQFTRPNDTTQYAIGDVIADSASAATILTFEPVNDDGRGAIIQAATLIDNEAPATKLDSELYLFDTAPTMQNDNAAWTPTDAELRQCIGLIAFPVANFKVAKASENGLIHVQSIALPVRPLAGRKIYGILIARNTYTPVGQETFKILLHLRKD